MEFKEIPDLTPILKKIFNLTDNIRTLRRAFSFSKTDERAKMDKQFIKKWREIEKRNYSAK